MNRILANLKARLDRVAIKQLQAEVVRLHEALELAEKRWQDCDADASYWYDTAMMLRQELEEQTPARVGLTQTGEQVIIK